MTKKKRLGHFPFGAEAVNESDYDFIPDMKDVEESRNRASDVAAPGNDNRSIEDLLSDCSDEPDSELAATEEIGVSGNFRKSLVSRFQAFTDYVKG